MLESTTLKELHCSIVRVADQIRQQDRLDYLLLAGLFLLTAPLYLYRLGVSPAPWFDEGIVLQSARNVAQRGEYALCIMNECTHFHPAIQTGPTVVLPIAGLFRLYGPRIIPARLVIVGYVFLAIVSFYRLTREVFGRAVAALAAPILVLTFDHEYLSFVMVGRQVLGEIPALAFFWLGTLLWFRSWKRRSSLTLIGAGLAWGLAWLTKVQFLVLVPATVIAFWLLDRFWERKLSLAHLLSPLAIGGGCVLTWYGYQIATLGPADFGQQVLRVGEAGQTHLASFSAQTAVRALRQVLGAKLFVLGLPSVAYALWKRIRGTRGATTEQVFLAMFSLVWLSWYVFLSLGWTRYAFVAGMMMPLFIAQSLRDIWRWAGAESTAARALPAVLYAALLLGGLTTIAGKLTHSPNSGLQDLVRYLNARIPVGSVIETWETEVGALTDHTYHHPPYEVTNAYTRHLWKNEPLPDNLYNPLVYGPQYLILGRFGRWTGIYQPDFLERNGTLVRRIGQYDVYEITTDEDS